MYWRLTLCLQMMLQDSSYIDKLMYITKSVVQPATVRAVLTGRRRCSRPDWQPRLPGVAVTGRTGCSHTSPCSRPADLYRKLHLPALDILWILSALDGHKKAEELQFVVFMQG